MNETQFIPDVVTGSEQGTGLAQVTPDTMATVVNAGYLPPFSEEDPYGYDLTNPNINILAASANIKFLYDNIMAQNEANSELGWDQMDDTEILMLAIGLHNSGPDLDFGTGYRIQLQNGELFDLEPSCTDPTRWECFQAMWYKFDEDGNLIKDTITVLFVNNIFGDINDPPR